MESKDTIVNARKKLEIHMESAMLCKRTWTREVATMQSNVWHPHL